MKSGFFPKKKKLLTDVRRLEFWPLSETQNSWLIELVPVGYIIRYWPILEEKNKLKSNRVLIGLGQYSTGFNTLVYTSTRAGPKTFIICTQISTKLELFLLDSRPLEINQIYPTPVYLSQKQISLGIEVFPSLILKQLDSESGFH